MTAIVSVFWRICIFKGGPDTLPANTTLLALIIVANALTSIVVSSFLQSLLPAIPDTENMDVAIVSDSLSLLTGVVVTQASTAGLVGLILMLMGHSSRLYQTLTAIFGTDIILTIVSAAAIFLVTLINTIIIQVVFLGTFFWNAAVLGFILHKALEISRGLGIAAAVFILIFTIAITQVTLST